MKRVGIIGLGTMGSTHAQAWQATQAQLIGVYDLDAAKALAFGERFGVPAFASREALIAAADIIDCCTPTYTHKDVVVAAASAGRDVICEKPMAMSLDDCATMIRAAERGGGRLFIAQVVRFFPEYAAAKRLIDDGAIGKPGIIRLRRGGSHPAEGASKWFGQEYLSGGVVLDLMVHDLDYARWVGGDVERVYCRRFMGTASDYALVTLRFRNGAIGHVEGSWAYPTGYFGTGFDIAGDDGLITGDSDSTRPLTLRVKQEQAASAGVVVPGSPLAPEDDPYLGEIQHFLRCLETGEEFLVTARDAMAAVQVALAARQSALSGEPVTLAPLAI